MKKRILVISNAYPNASHSYVNYDVEFLADRAEVLVLSKRQPSAPFYSPVEFNYFDNLAQLESLARQFRPDFIVSWMLPNHFYARHVAESLGVPFVLKIHTPDVFRLTCGRARYLDQLKALVKGEEWLSRSYRVLMPSLAQTARSPWLRGVYCIPALHERVAPHFPADKLRPLQPAFPYERFFNPGDNGQDILVLGSLVNRRENQVTFADTLAGIDATVDWIPVPTPGCLWLDVPGIPPNIHIRKYVPPADMPALYKRYKAMIVIGHGTFGRGLPMSVLEAQAAGVAVIAPSLRPDFDRFVTDGGGYLFEREAEIPALLAQIPDPTRREMGFRHAAQYGLQRIGQELALAGLTLD